MLLLDLKTNLLSFRITTFLSSLSSMLILIYNFLMVSNNTIQCNCNNYNSKCSTSNTTTSKCSCKTNRLSSKKFFRTGLLSLPTPHRVFHLSFECKIFFFNNFGFFLQMKKTGRKVSVVVAGDYISPLKRERERYILIS